MRRILTLVTLLSLWLVSGCSEGKHVLHVYNWSDYMAPEVVRSFEERFACSVILDFYDSNEALYAKLKAGAGGYDVIFPSSYMVKVMSGQGMLRELDHSLLPNLAHLDPEYLRFAGDPAMKYSVPYMIGTTGIGFLRSRVPDFRPSWKMFGNPAYAGRMTLLNDMREVIGIGLLTLGHSMNSVDENELAEAERLLLDWKQNIAKFESEQYKNGLVSGEFLLVQGFSGDLMQVMEENEDIAYVIPEEGTSLYADEMAIPQAATEVELAHQFINYLHTPEIAAAHTQAVYFLCPNRSSYPLLPAEIRENPSIFIPPEILARCDVARDLGPDNVKYTRVWDRVKAGGW
jgi:spermidine/putrescine transport system substrate-binding protein